MEPRLRAELYKILTDVNNALFDDDIDRQYVLEDVAEKLTAILKRG